MPETQGSPVNPILIEAYTKIVPIVKDLTVGEALDVLTAVATYIRSLRQGSAPAMEKEPKLRKE
jgi:hypothetical protein